MPTQNKYYPALSNLISLDKLPDSLEFVKTLSSSLFSKIYYKNYQASVSPRGDSAFYSLSIVSREKIDFTLAYDVKFVLNRDKVDDTISSFPITVQYKWPILAYSSYFNLDTFSFSAKEFYYMALNVFQLSEERVVNQAINVFVPSTSGDPIHQFVDDINAELGSDLSALIPYPTSANRLEELIQSIKYNYEDDAVAVVFLTYILDKADVNASKQNFKNFFKNLFPYDVEEYLKYLIKPQALVTLETSASIEFPRKVLSPWQVINQGGADVLVPDNSPDKKVYFDFAKALLYADTELYVFKLT